MEGGVRNPSNQPASWIQRRARACEDERGVFPDELRDRVAVDIVFEPLVASDLVAGVLSLDGRMVVSLLSS